MVEKQAANGFSSGCGYFPQVFHSRLWKEKLKKNKGLGRFYTYSQALFLILVLNMVLKVIRFRKSGEQADVTCGSGQGRTSNIIGAKDK